MWIRARSGRLIGSPEGGAAYHRVPRRPGPPSPALPAAGGGGYSRRASPRVVALLGLPGAELDRALPDRAARVPGDGALRSAAPRAAPVHLLLGLALHVAEPRMAGAHREPRGHPRRRNLRDGREQIGRAR